MATEPEETPTDSAPEPEPKVSHKSVIGVASLLILLGIASIRPEEEHPSWTRELPGRVDPPLETPESPAGEALLSGTVLGSTGYPVSDALVSTGTGELPAWEYTDVDGHFALEGLPAGEVVVHVIGDGHEPQDFSLASTSSGETLQLTTPLSAAPSLPELERVDVKGVVTPPRPDWGLEGYELWLEPMSPPHELGAPLASRATVQADRSVSFEGLIAGRYRAALLPPWAQTGTWPNLLDPDSPLISVGLSENSQLELVMIAGEIKGTVIDEQGKLVARALVGVHPAGQPNRLWRPTRTDDHGHFELSDLPVGTYRLYAYAGDMKVEHLIQVPGSSTLQVDLSLRQ